MEFANLIAGNTFPSKLLRVLTWKVPAGFSRFRGAAAETLKERDFSTHSGKPDGAFEAGVHETKQDMPYHLKILSTNKVGQAKN